MTPPASRPLAPSTASRLSGLARRSRARPDEIQYTHVLTVRVLASIR
jgi:hypothetical protein